MTAVLSDGRVEDFTAQASYSSNDRKVASVDENGVVKAGSPGETAVLVRAAGKVGTATVGVIGPSLSEYKPSGDEQLHRSSSFSKSCGGFVSCRAPQHGLRVHTSGLPRSNAARCRPPTGYRSSSPAKTARNARS